MLPKRSGLRGRGVRPQHAVDAKLDVLLRRGLSAVVQELGEVTDGRAENRLRAWKAGRRVLEYPGVSSRTPNYFVYFNTP